MTDSLNGWRDIASAPKDGTVVRLDGPDMHYPMSGKFERGMWCAVSMAMGFGTVDIPDPSAWQPLPPPPIEKDGK